MKEGGAFEMTVITSLNANSFQNEWEYIGDQMYQYATPFGGSGLCTQLETLILLTW